MQSVKKFGYVCFDLETTGFSHECNYIIEIGAEILDQSGVMIEDATFHSYVFSPKNIPYHIQNMTGITQDNIIDAPSFETTFSSFLEFIKEQISDHFPPVSIIFIFSKDLPPC